MSAGTAPPAPGWARRERLPLDPAAIVAHARQFNTARFERQMRALIDATLAETRLRHSHPPGAPDLRLRVGAPA